MVCGPVGDGLGVTLGDGAGGVVGGAVVAVGETEGDDVALAVGDGDGLSVALGAGVGPCSGSQSRTVPPLAFAVITHWCVYADAAAP